MFPVRFRVALGEPWNAAKFNRNTWVRFYHLQILRIPATGYCQGKVLHPNAPRNLGLSLIALGTLALAAATWQHGAFLKQLGESQPQHILSISFVIAILVVLIGCSHFTAFSYGTGPINARSFGVFQSWSKVLRFRLNCPKTLVNPSSGTKRIQTRTSPETTD